MADENIGKLMLTIGADIGELAKSFVKTASYVKDIQKAVSDVNFENMVKNAQVTARVIQSLRTQTVNGFNNITRAVKNTSDGFRSVKTAIDLSTKAFNRQEFDLHRIVYRLDAMNRSFKGVGTSLRNFGRDGQQETKKVEKSVDILGTSLLGGSRIMRAFSHNFVDGLSLMAAEFWVLSMAARTTYRILIAFPTKAIKSVDEYRLSVIKTQALISTFSPKDVDFGISFKNARDYARDLVAEMDILAAFTLGTSFDLQAITQEFMKQGVLVDINNKKAKDAFLNIANAIEIIASGFQAPELQIRQEARALAMGQVDLRATLATELNARLGGQLKERIALWKQEGSFIQNIGNLLQGYAESIKDIRSTWKSTSALFKTMSDRVLRFGSEAFYEAINKQLRKMTDYLQEHEVLIATKLHAGWKRLIILAESLKRSYETLQEPILMLIELGAKFFKGWGFILVGVIPVELQRISLWIRFLYNEVKDLLGLWMQIGQAMKDIGSDWTFSGTKALEKELKAIGEEQAQILKMLFPQKVSLFTQEFSPGQVLKSLFLPGYDEMVRRMKDFEDEVNEFKQSLGKKGVKTPGIMPFIDREKIESEYDAFLSSTSVKTSRWLDEESRKIDKHRESLIRNKRLLIEDEAAIAMSALNASTMRLPGGGYSRDLAQPTNEFGPRIGMKAMGIDTWMKEYIKIVEDADRKTKELIKDINVIADIQLMEKAEERRKMIAAPGVSISQRYSSPMQKSMSELTEFIRNQRMEIKKLVMSELLTQGEADRLLLGLDRNAIAERGRIIEESFQKMQEEIAKSDAFITERMRGKNDLQARLAKENEELARAQRELSRIYTQGIVLKQTYDDKMEAMSKASSQRKLIIEEQFNSEMLSKQLSLRKSQLSVAEIELTMSRAAVAKERLILSQQELEQELKILDTLSRIEGIGSLAWSEQREKVEELRESIANLGQTVRETTGSMGEGMRYAIEKYVRDSNSEFEYGSQFIQDSASGMTSFITSTFDDFRNRDLKSWSEYLENLINIFAQAAQKIVAEMMVVKAISMITGLFSMGVSASSSSNLTPNGLYNYKPPSFNSLSETSNIPGVDRLSAREGSSTSGTIINQAINFNIKEPMDAYSFDAYLERSHGKVKKIVADGIDQSSGFKKQVRGRNK